MTNKNKQKGLVTGSGVGQAIKKIMLEKEKDTFKIIEKANNAIKEADYLIKDSGQRRDFGTGAVRDMASGKGRFDLIPWDVIRALAVHYEKGCQKYGDRNWEKGIPVHSFCDSAMRHLTQFIIGRDDENHLIAAIWNAINAYQTILWIQQGRLPVELYDLPIKVKLPDPYGSSK